ncbi:lysophospholipase L1-like esterase [Paraburkholderia silvatlantica]|uniref:Lysophospholipase L1-like esterase n=1 Tax=Paraburkholderia silvatlantica TaxID=321895 RepID=A0A2V4TMW6_9BURK|nr:GDSL-type esterase/lipase family protein [Paraburkholderia silvatlantica]PYE16594.1 lysophospholipase L1-like esterase [Paraburkholderia silvatlantica]
MLESANGKPVVAPYFDEGLRKAKVLLSAVEPLMVDLLILGDSLAEGWPLEFFKEFKLAKLGVGGDRIENVRWRLREKDHSVIESKFVLIVAGTNNLWSGDSGILSFETLIRLVDDCKCTWPRANVIVQTVAPFAGQLAHINPQREIFNAAARARYTCVEPEAAFSGLRDCFEADHVHFATAGYAALTTAIELAIAAT